MKWYGWSVVSLVVLAGTMSAVALEPLNSSRSATSSRRGFVRPATITQAQATAPVAERIGSETPVHFRQATWNIWGGTYNGYVYSPDACDYRAPCVDDLWAHYSPHYLRCTGLHFGWGNRLGCRQCGHFGHRGCGCDDKVDCGCAVKAPVCGIEKAPVCGIEKAPVCGIEKAPVCGIEKPTCGVERSCGCGHHLQLGHKLHHFKHKCHGFWHRAKAHWSCSCGTDVGCGCGVEGKGGGEMLAPEPAADQPPAPVPTAEETQASHKVEVKEVRAIKLPAIGTGLRSVLTR